MDTKSSVGFFKEPVSALTHFAGAIAGVVGLVFLVVASVGDIPKLTGMAIYGTTLVLLFSASATYHFLDLGQRGNLVLRRIDHAAIFLFIAGSYVPACIHLLEGNWRIAILSLIGALALIGATVKVVWMSAPRWVTVAMYLAMGWLVVVFLPKLLPQLDAWSFTWLVGGGLAYSVGAIVYVKRWPDPWPERVGFHEIWHVFVLVGALFHFVFTAGLLDHPRPPFLF